MQQLPSSRKTRVERLAQRRQLLRPRQAGRFIHVVHLRVARRQFAFVIRRQLVDHSGVIAQLRIHPRAVIIRAQPCVLAVRHALLRVLIAAQLGERLRRRFVFLRVKQRGSLGVARLHGAVLRVQIRAAGLVKRNRLVVFARAHRLLRQQIAAALRLLGRVLHVAQRFKCVQRILKLTRVHRRLCDFIPTFIGLRGRVAVVAQRLEAIQR